MTKRRGAVSLDEEVPDPGQTIGAGERREDEERPSDDDAGDEQESPSVVPAKCSARVPARECSRR